MFQASFAGEPLQLHGSIGGPPVAGKWIPAVSNRKWYRNWKRNERKGHRWTHRAIPNSNFNFTLATRVLPPVYPPYHVSRTFEFSDRISVSTIPGFSFRYSSRFLFSETLKQKQRKNIIYLLLSQFLKNSAINLKSYKVGSFSSRIGVIDKREKKKKEKRNSPIRKTISRGFREQIWKEGYRCEVFERATNKSRGKTAKGGEKRFSSNDFRAAATLAGSYQSVDNAVVIIRRLQQGRAGNELSQRDRRDLFMRSHRKKQRFFFPSLFLFLSVRWPVRRNNLSPIIYCIIASFSRFTAGEIESFKQWIDVSSIFSSPVNMVKLFGLYIWKWTVYCFLGWIGNSFEICDFRRFAILFSDSLWNVSLFFKRFRDRFDFILALRDKPFARFFIYIKEINSETFA